MRYLGRLLLATLLIGAVAAAQDPTPPKQPEPAPQPGEGSAAGDGQPGGGGEQQPAQPGEAPAQAGAPAEPATPPSSGTPGEAPAPRGITLAVIVHPDNPVTGISFNELRAYLKLERQFWPNNKRCQIYLPPSDSPEGAYLLANIYKLSQRKLQKYWVRKMFSGEIPAKPSYVPSARAAGLQVLQNQGALSVIDAAQVPDKVRVLAIDGKKPGEEGYPLVAPAEAEKPATGDEGEP